MGEKQRINGMTDMVCLLGSPVGHSMSPAMHNRSFELLGVNAAYLAFDVKSEYLGTIIAAMKEMEGVVGCNVTMPCKRDIIPFLDEVSDAAELMDAVNVVHFTGGKAVGHNADGAGFMENLRENDVKTVGETLTLVGPGGAGSAILVQSALDGAKKIHVFARGGGSSYKTAEMLIPRILERVPSCEILLHDLGDEQLLADCIAESDILVNATSIGMGEGSTEVPVPAKMLRSDLIVADAIYFPRETQLLKNAAAVGCKTVSGLGMLLHQAALGEKIWFGVKMPIDVIADELFA